MRYASRVGSVVLLLGSALWVSGCSLDFDRLTEAQDGGEGADGGEGVDAGQDGDAGEDGDAGTARCRHVERVAVGRSHTCAIAEGALYCWGANGSGQLGLGTREPAARPTLVASGYSAVTVSVGAGADGAPYTCGIRTEDGSLWCWGQWSPALGLGGSGGDTDVLEPTRVSIPEAGAPTAWLSVTAGREHTCGVVADGAGTAYCWGSNAFGQLGQGDIEDQWQPSLLGQTGWTEIDAGSDHNCGLADVSGQRRLLCWGDSRASQAGYVASEPRQKDLPDAIRRVVPPSNTSEFDGWAAVSAGHLHSMGISEDQRLWAMGSDANGQLGNELQLGSFHLVENDYAEVSAGDAHTCGIRASDGSLWCWGSNFSGQLGTDGGPADVSRPAMVDPGPWDQVHAGVQYTCGVRAEGTLWCWGDNSVGQLGIEASAAAVPAEVCVR